MTTIKLYKIYMYTYEGIEYLANEYCFSMKNSIPKETIDKLSFSRINITLKNLM